MSVRTRRHHPQEQGWRSTFLAGQGVIRRHPARLFTLVKSSNHLT
jgi:hypothetical protein